MKQLFAVVIAFAVGASVTGCARISTQVVEKPRVDQELEKGSGNRGYLIGKAPAPGPRKTTRKMFQTDIEMATKDEMNPWKNQNQKGKPSAAAQTTQPAPTKTAAAPEPAPQTNWQDEESEPAPKVAAVPTSASTDLRIYVVKKNDNLEKIAAEVYGDSNKWRRIFEANKDSLKSPNRIYVGQKLVIPNLPAEQKATKSAQQQTYK